jgi:hypothetical protein
LKKVGLWFLVRVLSFRGTVIFGFAFPFSDLHATTVVFSNACLASFPHATYLISVKNQTEIKGGNHGPRNIEHSHHFLWSLRLSHRD